MGGAVAMCDPSHLEQNRLQRNRTLTEFVHISCSLPPVVFVAGAIVTIAAIPQIVRNHRNPNQVSQQSIWGRLREGAIYYLNSGHRYSPVSVICSHPSGET